MIKIKKIEANRHLQKTIDVTISMQDINDLYVDYTVTMTEDKKDFLSACIEIKDRQIKSIRILNDENKRDILKLLKEQRQ